MRKWMAVCLIVAGSFAPAGVMMAQDAAKPAEAPKTEPAAHYYHLQFVIQELDADGKATNSRTYTTTVSTARDEFASIRSGSKIPIVTSTFAGGEGKAAFPTQWQYIDVGVNIDARHAMEVGRQLSLNLTAEISSAATSTDPALHQPVVRQNKWQAVVLIPVGKASTVFTSDTLDSKGSMQMVVTATPVP